ncbi:protein BZR1 homolog 4-like [Salvia miltiorrhiza]|uniref:protein BZR1 homolog 4-like n=1 Tax=Salvia miltiorrhiza TaxID=226208 RepID=UPI0025AB64C7|nr:protein BZR1 homolog 4-like [Salvia miltiorrhiza]
MMKERGTANGRSALERERTKMRERQRRSITTTIFHGLRKHGGYRLSPRADINEVLRHLALEAGWTVDPDGTTYRSATSTSTGAIACPLCGGGRRSAPATPSCSFLGGGGECSTTASPRRVGDSAANNLSSNGVVATDNDALLGIYVSGAAPLNGGGGGGGSAVFGEGQQLYLVRETRASNQNTPAGSP